MTQENQHIRPNYEQIKDNNNSILLEVQTRFNQVIRSLYTTQTNPLQAKVKLIDLYSISDSLISVKKLSPIVEKYIQFLSFDIYNSNLYRNGVDLKNIDRATNKAYYDQPKDPIYFFGDPMILGFYNGINNIINYLDVASGLKPYSRRKSLDKIREQYYILDSIISDTSVKDQTIAQLLKNFIGQYREGTDFESDLNSYIEQAQKIANSNLQQHVIRAFENLRYTLTGSPWVNYTFSDTEGQTIKLDQYKGKYVYVDVWASWCIPCIQMIPHFQSLEQDYKDENIVFVALSIDSDQKKWMNKVNQLNLKGNQLWDSQGEFSKLMNISGIPHYLLYDTEGRLLEYKTYAPNSEKLKNKLNELLKNNKY